MKEKTDISIVPQNDKIAGNKLTNKCAVSTKKILKFTFGHRGKADQVKSVLFLAGKTQYHKDIRSL